MPTRRAPSLSGVRAAVLASGYGSLTRAATDLGVSPSAVSHQVRKLEDELGVALFERHANALRPTVEGRAFLERATAALAMLDEAANGLHRDADETRVQASYSFATRWLIPALGRMTARHPRLRVKVETVTGAEPPRGHCDVSIGYRRRGEAGMGERLATDLVLPMVSPWLPTLRQYRTRRDFSAIPALHATSDGWDWDFWCRSQAIGIEALRFDHTFDTDDAAIRGAVAGVGMVLASPLLTQHELQAGDLVPLPGFEPVELGCYEVRVRQGERRSARQFCQWMAGEVAGQHASSATEMPH